MMARRSTKPTTPSVQPRELVEASASLDELRREWLRSNGAAWLPPSLHDKAKSRYEAVRRHLEGTAAFFDQIEHFYPQGSMAIDATISTRGTDDEYDLDIVSQLGGRFRDMKPLEVLDELESALTDYPVQRVLLQTRCVTLFYADKMDLDVTPSLRVYGMLDRESLITHAKGPRGSPTTGSST